MKHLRRHISYAIIAIMRALISTHLIKSLKPSETPVEVRDERVKGFLLRVQPSGSMTYYVEYQRGKRKRIGPEVAFKPDEARTEAKKVLFAYHKGEDLKADERRKSIENLKTYLNEIYEPRIAGQLKSAKDTCARMRYSFAKLLKSPLNEITVDTIADWRAVRLGEGRKKTTVNRDLNDLKAALTRAVDWGFLDENPLRAVKPLRTDGNAKCRFLDDEEMQHLRTALDNRETRLRDDRQSGNAWRKARGKPLMRNLERAAFADYLKPMVLLSVNTGLRRGELFSLTWDEVDLVRANLTVSGGTAKSGKTRHVPLNSEAKYILESWKRQIRARNGFVFKSRNGEQFDNVGSSWAGLLKDARIDNFRWHDLRHTFASRLVMAGVDLNTVRELLGHSDYKMTLRYAHLAPAHKAAAVEKLVVSP